MTEARFVSMAVACELIGKHPNTIRRWHADGLLPHTKRTPGGHRWFLLADLRAVLNGANA